MLQILDLLVNKLIKGDIRNQRAIRLYEYFQGFQNEFKTWYEKVDRDAAAEPKFKPPKQTMAQGIRDLLQLHSKWNTPDGELKGVQRSFIATGSAPTYNDDGTTSFKQYDPSLTEQSQGLEIHPSFMYIDDDSIPPQDEDIQDSDALGDEDDIWNALDPASDDEGGSDLDEEDEEDDNEY